MARYRSRSRSLSPRRRSRSPPRGRKRYDDEPRDRYRDSRSHRDRRSPAPSGLLVRNLPLDARSEDLRIPFERFGPVKDVYLPKNFYTGEPRGFGFVKFRHGEDAAEAKQQLNHTVIGGREIRIVFAEENRKTPQEMRVSSHSSGRHGGGSYRGRSPPRSPRRRYRSYSRSPSPARHDSSVWVYFVIFLPANLKKVQFLMAIIWRYRFLLKEMGMIFHVDCCIWDRGARKGYRSPVQSRSISRSPSPRDREDYRNQRFSSPRENGRGLHEEKDLEPGRSRSPRGNSRSPLASRS